MKYKIKYQEKPGGRLKHEKPIKHLEVDFKTQSEAVAFFNANINNRKMTKYVILSCEGKDR